MYGSPHKELSVSRPGILFLFGIFLHLFRYLLQKVYLKRFWRKSEFRSVRFAIVGEVARLATCPALYFAYRRLSAWLVLVARIAIPTLVGLETLLLFTSVLISGWRIVGKSPGVLLACYPWAQPKPQSARGARDFFQC